MRLPAFTWPTLHYNGTRLVPMRWLDLHYIRENPYSARLTPYAAGHKEYLANLAKTVMQDPAGERTLMDWHLFASGYVCREDTLQRQPTDAIRNPDGTLTDLPSIWLTDGIKFTKAKLNYIFGILKKSGLELDYYTTQHEWSLTPWAMSDEQLRALPLDPRWKRWSRRLGFNNLDGVRFFWMNEENHNQMIKFNEELYYSTAEALQASLYSVLKKYWPRIKITDYGHYYINPKYECYDTNGWPMRMTRINPWSGACADLNYISMNQFAWTAPAHIAPFPNTPWNRFVMSLNQARAIKNSNKTKPFHPEFAGFKQLTDWGLADIDVYREHIFHAALTGADALQFWMVQKGDGEIIDEILNELDAKLDGNKPKFIEDHPIEWHPKIMQTTCKIGRKTLTRTTDQNFIGRWIV